MSLLKKLSQKEDGGWLQKEIEDLFEEETKGSAWAKPDFSIHPSGAVSDCTRFLALGMVGYRGKHDGKTKRILENGTYMHLRWTEYFKVLPNFVAADAEVRGDGVKGHCDILMKEPITSNLIVGELKSISPFGYSALPTPASPEQNLDFFIRHYPGYAAQLQLYMHNIIFDNFASPEKGFFLFENKADQSYLIYWINKDTDALNRLLLNARMAQSSVEGGVIPEAPYDRTEKICKLCKRKSVCFGLQDGDPAITKNIQNRLEKGER